MFRLLPGGLSLLMVLAFMLGCPGESGAQHATEGNSDQQERMDLLQAYADRILEHGRDQWSGEETPLFADGINVDTGEPAVWRYNGEEYIISNQASQQNLFRFLTGLSNLTDDDTYRQAAEDAVRHMFDHYTDSKGLLYWGGHEFVDLNTLEPANNNNAGFDSQSHEFKNHFPFYELMYDVDPGATVDFLRALWSTHVQDWSRLDMNRHGSWGGSIGNLWDHDFARPEPFFEGRGLTFINAGSDLMYAAGQFYQLEQEQGAIDWAKRLNNLYVDARHPETGLGVYQYSKPERREDPPEEGSLAEYTNSRYGDRAENQFGKQYSEITKYDDVAKEGWVHWGGRIKAIYVDNGFMQLALADEMEGDGEEFLTGTKEGLKALAEHAYVPEENHFPPMWADGTDLTGEVFPRTGYYGGKGSEWQPYEADMEFLMTYARAYRLTGEEVFWEMARNIADGHELGNIGSASGQNVSLNMGAETNGAHEIFALIELYRAAEHPDYLERAEYVADQMIENHYHDGYFLPSESHIHARFDRIDPLAILTLEATMQQEPEKVPSYTGGDGYIHGNFDGKGRTYDDEAIWSVTRDEVEPAVVQLTAPGEGSVVEPENPEFSWEASTYAEEYRFQITDSNFSDPANILLDSTLTETSLTFPGNLQGDHNYRWRVQSIGEHKEGSWSEDNFFYTSAATSAFSEADIPSEFQLRSNYPNPFNPVTTISYGLPEDARVELKIYDLTGRQVAQIVGKEQGAGYHSIEFDASALASGVYMYRLSAVPVRGSGSERVVKTRKMTVVK